MGTLVNKKTKKDSKKLVSSKAINFSLYSEFKSSFIIESVMVIRFSIEFGTVFLEKETYMYNKINFLGRENAQFIDNPLID